MLENVLLLPSLLLAGPGDPPPLSQPAQLFPANSYAMVEFAGLDACTAAADQQGLMAMAEQLLKSSQGIEFDQLLAGQVVPELDQALGQLGMSRGDVHAVLRGRMALGVSRMTFFDEEPLPSMVLAVQGGDVGRNLLRQLFNIVGSRAPAAERLQQEVEGVQIDIVRAGNDNGAIAMASVEGWNCLASNPAYLADVVRTARGRQQSLADSLGQAGLGSSDGQLLSTFINVGPFWDALQLVLPYEAVPILDALGVQRVEGLQLSLATTESAGHDALRAVVRHDEEGLAAALLPRGDVTGAARLCPPETLFMMSHAVDLPGLMSSGARLIEALPGAVRGEIREEALGEMTEELAREGIDIDQVLGMIRAFGPNVTVAVSAPSAEAGGFSFPAISLYAEVQGEGMHQHIAQLLTDQGAPLQRVEFQGQAIHYAKIQQEGLRMSPSMAQIGNRLVFTSDLRQMKATIARHAKEGARSLADEADFQHVLQRYDGSSSLLALRIGHHLASYYKAFAPMIDGMLAQNDEIGLTLDDLPTPEELRKVLADTVLAVRRDPRGITMSSEGTVTLSTGLALAGAAAQRALSAGASHN